MAIKAIQDIGFNAYLNYYYKIHFDRNCYFTGDSVGKINYFVAIVMVNQISSTMDFDSIASMDLHINRYYYYHSYNFIAY